MNKPARRHHFLPQFYLAAFTNHGTKDSLFWILDQDTSKQREDKPKNVAYRNNFYSVEIANSEPDEFEKALGRFEALAAQIVKDVIQSHIMPKDEDYLILINFIALLACRVPSRREVFNGAMNDVMKMQTQMIFQYPERYDVYRKMLVESGYELNDTTTYEEMKAFVNDESRYTISFHNHTHIKNMMIALDTTIPLLLERCWSVLLADEQTGYFICSDSPLNLHWTKPMDSIWGPGFGSKGTDVTIPLSKNILLLGRFEEELPTQYLSRESIAIMNSYTASDSQRYVYSSNKEFIWYTRSNTIGDMNDLFKEMADRRR
jgi:hypothetical protein